MGSHPVAITSKTDRIPLVKDIHDGPPAMELADRVTFLPGDVTSAAQLQRAAGIAPHC